MQNIDRYLEVKDGRLSPEGGVGPGYGDRDHQHGEGARHPAQDITHLVHILTPAHTQPTKCQPSFLKQRVDVYLRTIMTGRCALCKINCSVYDSVADPDDF